MDETTLDVLKELCESLISEMDYRFEQLKTKYNEHPEDAALSYEQGMIHGIDVAVQKIFSLIGES